MQIKSIIATGAIAVGLVLVGGTGGAVAGSLIDGGDVKNGTLSGADLRNGSVTDADIADGAVDSGEVENGTITGTDIRDETVTTKDIDDGSINSNDLNESVVQGLEQRIENGRYVGAYTEQAVGVYLEGHVQITVYAEGDATVKVENSQGRSVTCTSTSVENGGTGSCSATRVMSGVVNIDGTGTFEASLVTLGG